MRWRIRIVYKYQDPLGWVCLGFWSWAIQVWDYFLRTALRSLHRIVFNHICVSIDRFTPALSHSAQLSSQGFLPGNLLYNPLYNNHFNSNTRQLNHHGGTNFYFFPRPRTITTTTPTKHHDPYTDSDTDTPSINIPPNSPRAPPTSASLAKPGPTPSLLRQGLPGLAAPCECGVPVCADHRARGGCCAGSGGSSSIFPCRISSRGFGGF